MRRIIATAFALAGFATAVHADAIDGEWCSGKGENIKIDGPSIRIPSGKEMTGRYTRHSFAYEDKDEGQVIIMEQLSEEEMRLARVKDGVASPMEEWRRCNVTS